jgi:predicted transglutaminase-like cysteine proteinase
MRARALLLVAALLPMALPGCATRPKSWVTYRFFVEAQPGDVWFEKVRDWQRREIDDQAADAQREARGEVATGSLRTAFGKFADEERRKLAQRFVVWTQEQAMIYYRFDEKQNLDGDEWPTSHDLFAQNGDDCDGLDLIAYNLLIELGFPEQEIFRAVIRRDYDDEFHMVTLWFENPDDPWVIDATGAMTLRMRRLSEVPGWTPAVIFNAKAHYTVHRLEHTLQAGN